MKIAIFGVVCSCLLLSGVARAQSIFNTGTNASGAKQASGTDIHYNIVSGPGITTPVSAAIFSVNLPGSYVTSSTANWIWRNNDGSPGSVTYVFETTFNLTGFNPATATLTGRYATDNLGSVTLNGNAPSSGASSGTFTSFTNFSFASSAFVSGVNSLRFSVTDQGAPGGLLVDSLVLSAQSVSAAPEPASLALCALPIAGFLARRRRA